MALKEEEVKRESTYRKLTKWFQFGQLQTHKFHNQSCSPHSSDSNRIYLALLKKIIWSSGCKCSKYSSTIFYDLSLSLLGILFVQITTL